VLYDVTTITIRPGSQAEVLAKLEVSMAAEAGTGKLLACWFSDVGALNQILLIHARDEGSSAGSRAIAKYENPLAVGEFLTGLSLDTYVSFPFVDAMTAGRRGPVFEVRTYLLKPDGLGKTMELWQEALPARTRISPLLAAMYSVAGPAIRFMHIWPYGSVEERGRLRAKAVADGVWPPPGGPDHLATQQSDIYLPATFSPIH
jgi:hypothetical protein